MISRTKKSCEAKFLAITAGDPCGIGPEVVLKALALVRFRSTPIAVIGDRDVFARTARRLQRPLPDWHVIAPGQPVPAALPCLIFLDRGSRQTHAPGRSGRRAGRAALDYLDRAIELWGAGRVRALVTAPVTKWAIIRSEPGFVGQTEYLAEAMRARRPVMMFVSEGLRVVVLTRHLPLRRVPDAVTRELLRSTLRQTARALRGWFRIRRPRLAVCGLNPHAGEDGRCGQEERSVMRPALLALRRQGILCDGPFAADGLFGQPIPYDAVVCAYHDQGLIPFKMVARDVGCQLSVGLPIVRTSPDHGSALDIAGQGKAHPGSMVYALKLTARLAVSDLRHQDEP